MISKYETNDARKSREQCGINRGKIQNRETCTVSVEFLGTSKILRFRPDFRVHEYQCATAVISAYLNCIAGNPAPLAFHHLLFLPGQSLSLLCMIANLASFDKCSIVED